MKTKNLDLNYWTNLAKIQEIYQYRKAGYDLTFKQMYIRGRCGYPQEGHPYHIDIYVTYQNEIFIIAYDTSVRRARNIKQAWMDGTYWNYSSEILENYSTNGWNTRIGLYRSQLLWEKSEKKRKVMRQISKSHADYIGHETGNSKLDHIRRIQIRQQW